MQDFSEISTTDYIKYIEKAEFLQDKGLHTDKSVIELAKMIYERDHRSIVGG